MGIDFVGESDRMCIVLADGPPDLEIKGDVVTITLTSGGDVYCTAFRLGDANAAVASYLEQLEARDGRKTNLVAFPRAHADRA